MIQNSRVLCIVPARSGSKGLPGKNIRLLGGKPLLAWPVAAARASRYVDRVIVSTDNVEFAKIAVEYGAEVPFLRPAELAADDSPSSAAVLHVLDALAKEGDIYDYFVLLEPTSPLTEASDVDSALEALLAARRDADAIVSVSELVSSHPAFAVRVGEDRRVSPYSAIDFTRLPRRQDIDPVFALDGSLYISAVDAYREHRSFCHQRTLSHEMPRYKSFEVDDLVDFICIEAILGHHDQVSAAS